jgi:hypothetical protein
VTVAVAAAVAAVGQDCEGWLWLKLPLSDRVAALLHAQPVGGVLRELEL